jgi:hypothetical protein
LVTKLEGSFATKVERPYIFDWVYMIDKILTFTGSVLCAFLWARLFTALDVSSTKQQGSFIRGLIIGSIVGLVFVAADLIICTRSEDRYLRMVYKVFLLASLGSIATLAMLGGALIAFGYIRFENLSIEAVGALILAFLLFLSNFVSVLGLKTIYYLFRKSVRNSLD